MKQRKSSALLRVQRYYRRQHPDTPAWGADYSPAIHAVREEAPGRSRPSIITGLNRIGRPLHTLSLPERSAMLLALYNPTVIDLHEQRVLDPAPGPHPLHGHPTEGVGQYHLGLPGTWAVAEQLGYMRYHPTLCFVDAQGNRRRAPHPLVGDLLLFLKTAEGAYCVNWNIKAVRGDFKCRRPDAYTCRNPTRSYESAVARNAIERANYAAAEIPTHEIAGNDLPPTVIDSLHDGFAAQARPALPTRVRNLIIGHLRDIIGTPLTPMDVLNRVSLEHGINHAQFRDCLFAAVWRRELRVDLFRRTLFDRPLRPEHTDVLEHYSRWFQPEVTA